MNDGGTDYKNHHAVDSLAFGHCDYSYRNLGRPSKLQIKQEPNIFEVSIDDRLCFSSDKIRLPPNYHFGITAASAETPDSFEAYKFVLHTAQSISREEPRRDQPPQQNNFQQGDSSPDASAPSYRSSEAQFEDLHNRMQMMAHSIDALVGEVSHLAGKAEHRQQEAVGRHEEIMVNMATGARINNLDRKLEGLEQTIRNFQGEFHTLQTTVRDQHSSLSEGLPRHMSDSKSISHCSTRRTWLLNSCSCSHDNEWPTHELDRHCFCCCSSGYCGRVYALQAKE